MPSSQITQPSLVKLFKAKANYIKLALAICLSIVSLASQAYNVQKVTVERVERLLFYPENKATALSKAINHALVPAQISAQVTHIKVQLGSVVEKGQILVNLDCQDKLIDLTVQQSELVVAKAQLVLANRSFERAVQLKKNRHIGEAELDESEIGVTIAQEKLRQASSDEKSANLSVQRCEVVAPFSGVVSARLVSEGDYVNTGQSLITVLEKDNIEIEAQIPLDQMANFRQAGHYSFISHEQKYPIELKNTVNFIASNSRSQVVTFSLKNKTSTSNYVLAGMNGMVSWQSQKSFLPAHLLTQRHGRYGVFIIDAVKGSSAKSTVAKFIALPDAQEGRPFSFDAKQHDISTASYIIIDGRHRVSADAAVAINKNIATSK